MNSTKIQLKDGNVIQLNNDTLTLSGITSIKSAKYTSDHTSTATSNLTIADFQYVTGKTNIIDNLKIDNTLTHNHVLIGNSSNLPEEKPLINQWVTSLDDLDEIGQKTNQEVQSVMKTALNDDLIHQCYHIVTGISLTSTGTTQLINNYNVYGNEKLITSSMRLVIENYSGNTGTTDINISIGNNPTNNNILSSTGITISSGQTVYILPFTGDNISIITNPVNLSVISASNIDNLTCKIVIDGLIFTETSFLTVNNTTPSYNWSATISGTLGSSLRIYWGDGEFTDYDFTGADQTISHTYVSTGFYNQVWDGDIEEITKIVANNKRLTGSLSNEWNRLNKLTYLNIGSNTLNGSIDPLKFISSGITYFAINNNSFSGDLGTSEWIDVLKTWTNIQYFWIQFNSFTGDLSSWSTLSSWTNILDFRINNNSFTGDLSSWSALSS
ncbi:MAG: hypothetical protein ACOCZ5_03675, partial [bacterium]